MNISCTADEQITMFEGRGMLVPHHSKAGKVIAVAPALIFTGCKAQAGWR